MRVFELVSASVWWVARVSRSSIHSIGPIRVASCPFPLALPLPCISFSHISFHSLVTSHHHRNRSKVDPYSNTHIISSREGRRDPNLTHLPPTRTTHIPIPSCLLLLLASSKCMSNYRTARKRYDASQQVKYR